MAGIPSSEWGLPTPAELFAGARVLIVDDRYSNVLLLETILRTEGVEQPAHGAIVVHAVLGTAGQADQAVGMLEHGLRRHPGL